MLGRMERDLMAAVAGYLRYTPDNNELRSALARKGDDKMLPRGTYNAWKGKGRGSGLDRTSDSLLRVANYYSGKADADGNIIDAASMYGYLMDFFGYAIGEEQPDFPVTTKRKVAKKNKASFDLRTLGE